MKMIATLFVVFALTSSALGECPVPATVPGADSSKIAGRWYQIAGPTGETLSCLTGDFTPREDGNFNLTMLAIKSDGSKHDEIVLAERAEDQSLLNLWSMSYKTPYPVTFYIADTDYDNYFAAYTCFIVPPRATLQTGLIFSRTNTMSAEKYAELYDLLVNKVGVSNTTVVPVNQKDCKYWPAPEY